MLRPSRTSSPFGFSLVELLIATSILGTLALSLITVLTSAVEGQRTVLQRQSALSLQLMVTGVLGDRKVCELNFAGLAAAGAHPVAEVLSASVPTREVIVRQGDGYENNSVRMKSISLEDYRPYSSAGVDRYRGLMSVHMHVSPSSATPDTAAMRRSVTLLVELNGFRGLPNPDRIATCVAVGAEQNSIWSVKSNNDIYYSGFNVGIGTDQPSQMLTVNGNVLAQAYFHSSDARLKLNVTPAPGLAALKRLRGVRFRWRDTGRAALGVIAQDVERVFPEAVFTDARTSLKSVAYDQLIGPLIEGVKQLDVENARLARDIAELERARAGR